MKQRLLRLFIIPTVIFCLLFCGCDGGGDVTYVTETDSEGNVITVTVNSTAPTYAQITELVDRNDGDAEYIKSIRSYEIIKPEKTAGYSRCAYGMSDGYYYTLNSAAIDMDDELRAALYQISGDGSVRAVPIPVMDREAAYAVLLPDDSVAVIYTYNSYTDAFICRFDREGTLLGQTDLPTGQYNSNAFDAEVEITDDGRYRILLLLMDHLIEVDETMQILSSVAMYENMLTELFKLNGKYYVIDYADVLYEIDFEKKVLLETDDNPLPEDVWSSHLHCDPDGNVYYDTDLGLYRMEADGTQTTVAEWMSGGATNVTVRHIADKDTIFAETRKTLIGEGQLVILDCAKEKQLEQKRRLIRIGYLSVTLDDVLEQAVSTFNAENDNYYIQLIDYSSKTQYGRTTALEQDLLDGTMPDMLFYSDYHDMANLYDKGVFVDLNPFFGDRILGGLKNAMMRDGYLWGIPFSMTVRTFTALQSVADGALTPEKFYALADGLSGKGDMPEFSADDVAYENRITMVDGHFVVEKVPVASNDDMPFPGEVVTGSHESIRHIYESGLYDFVDYEKKNASFDSKEFCDFIENLKRIDEEYVHKNAGIFSGSGQFRYKTSSAYTRDNLLSGNVKLLYTYIGDVGAYAALKHLYNGNAFTLCGYPSRDGCGAHITTSKMMSVFSGSSVHGGCREFIEYMLSEDIQNSDIVIESSIPVTREALSLAIDTYRYYYYTTTGENYLGVADVSSKHLTSLEKDIEAGRIAEVVITDEDKAVMMDFFETCHMETGFDPVVKQIVEEELSFWNGGARTLEETAKIIQSRVWIYLNE